MTYFCLILINSFADLFEQTLLFNKKKYLFEYEILFNFWCFTFFKPIFGIEIDLVFGKQFFTN
jgi:hypothetical protein